MAPNSSELLWLNRVKVAKQQKGMIVVKLYQYTSSYPWYYFMLSISVVIADSQLHKRIAVVELGTFVHVPNPVH
ncbi:hypothetical protein Asppvi_010439 [Aspergillus pseudoviridinutans]|uniref:Uncharacterized protein n=1 Tax=Aspergillus pseudoviridinutans TaxID=1517512 RepID=A0A9P3BNA0_9EURO|nr:uncharacterized protein Asppvi_010439 [Aspergillus pseudoviridinutans]GIJ91473.1 hypothetical protein Asppvi_010439 [Aspergillus pseudoviridinutans]